MTNLDRSIIGGLIGLGAIAARNPDETIGAISLMLLIIISLTWQWVAEREARP